MYNPPESGNDSLEYIEIYNSTSNAVNLDGWTFSDGIEHTFGNVTIGAEEYLVLAVNSGAIMRNFGISAIQWDGGALTNGGEGVAISNSSGSVVSAVDYDDEAGWPTSADGTDGEGASIELCDYNGDITDPSNWKASTNDLGVMINGRLVMGTPGTRSSCVEDDVVLVEVTSNVFTPKDITINVGETVRWENRGGVHNVNGQQSTYPNNPDSFFSGNPSGSAWVYDYTFNTPGFYNYQCDPHVSIGMVGTITVVEPEVPAPKLVITEIMYNDPGPVDSLEFIEVYNADENPVDLAGVFFDSGPQFNFPSTMLGVGEFMIIAKDSATFKRYFGIDAQQWDSGDLNDDGGVLLISNPRGDTIDVLSYLDGDPWPSSADGGGYSLTLCDPDTDNALGENWGVGSIISDIGFNSSIIADPGSLTYCGFTIGEAIATDQDGVSMMEDRRVALTGVAHAPNFRPGGLQFSLIDDVSDGIGVFSSSQSFNYEVTDGDRLTVLGTIDQFNGLIQIIVDDLILVTQGDPLSGPVIVESLGEETESRLVTLENLRLIDPEDWGGTGSGFNAEMTNGTDTFTIRIDADTDLFMTNYPTGTFDVTGFGGQFDASSPYLSGYQLIPRNMEDINPFVPFVEMFPARSIPEMTTEDQEGVADSLEIACTLTGQVYGINMRPSGLQFTIIDSDNNGIGIFNGSGDLGYTFNQGDVISISGTIDQFNGLTQINPEAIAVVSTGQALLEPKLVTSLGEETESSYIRLNNVSIVDPSEWEGDGSSFNVRIMDDQGTEMVMRIDNDSELSSMPAPESPFNVVGIGGQFDRNLPLDEGYQIFPFFSSDFSSSSSLDDILDGSTIKVFPNPVEDRLYVRSEEEVIFLELFDLQGRLLIKSTQSDLDVGPLSQGTYLLRVETKKGGLMKKIIIE